MTKYLISFVALVSVWIPWAHAAEAPRPTPTTTTTTSVLASPKVTTTVTPAIHATHAECAGWLALARQVGWADRDLPTLEFVLWRESRCLPTVYNAKDPNGGSHGLTQVNGFWCRPSRYYPNGYLQHHGVLTTCEDLYAPAINLRAALALYDYSDGWAQWYLP